MKTLGLLWMITWLFQTAPGRLALLILLLWYLDNRYFGIVAAAMAPIHHQRRIASLRQTVRVNPSDVRAMVELGEHYLRSGRYQAAAEYLEQAFSRGEDSARAHYLLGGALVKLGRHDQGRERLEKALALQPNVSYGEPYLFLIEEAAARGDFGRIADLVDALEQFESVEILTRAGHLCRQAGQAELARRLFEEAVSNYQYIPAKMRRRERRWLWRARLGQMQTR